MLSYYYIYYYIYTPPHTHTYTQTAGAAREYVATSLAAAARLMAHDTESAMTLWQVLLLYMQGLNSALIAP